VTRGTARGFYFDSDFDVTTVGFDFPPPVRVNHTNEAWALFGQVSCALTESPRVTAGLRVGHIAGNGEWEIAAFARNITNEDNVLGVADFNNNTAFVNEPGVIGVSFGISY